MLPTPGMSAVPHAKKKPVHAYELFLKYGGEGGIDSLRSPLLGPSLGLAPAGPTQALFKNAPGVFVGAARSQAGSLSNWLRQLSNPGRGFSSPRRVPHAKKKPVHAYELFLKYGGEGGIRTPDTLPYTHFPGVLLQPLGHLTILSFPLLSGTGANVGKYVSPVNQLFAKKARLDKLRATCSLNVRNPFFLSPVAFPFSLRGNLLCWQTNRKQ